MTRFERLQGGDPDLVIVEERELNEYRSTLLYSCEKLGALRDQSPAELRPAIQETMDYLTKNGWPTVDRQGSRPPRADIDPTLIPEVTAKYQRMLDALSEAVESLWAITWDTSLPVERQMEARGMAGAIRRPTH